MNFLIHFGAGIGMFLSTFLQGHLPQLVTLPQENTAATSSMKYTTVDKSALTPIPYPPNTYDGFALSYPFFTDGKQVYFVHDNEKAVNVTDLLPSADAHSFEYIPLSSNEFYMVSAYEKDATHVWYGTQLLAASPAPDPKTFVIVADVNRDWHDEYAKDKNHVYFNGNVLAGADSSTFIHVPNTAGLDSKDKDHQYLDGKIVK